MPVHLAFAFLGGFTALVATTGGTQDAVANGDTRTLSFLHTHTGESASVTFRRDGRYDDAALKQLNWLLRDWRVEKPAEMDPRLFDILWEVYREVGSHQPINVVSAYRSPETNAMLRRRSKAVSEHSQHMAGKAMDIRLPDVDTATLRAAAMKLQYGGVGYYASSAFVHVDTGSVRAWPRMSEQQLARLFPDGKTVHLPPSGKPMARYEEARLEVDSRKASLGSGGSGPSLGSIFAGLFRSDDVATPAAPTAKVVAATRVAAAPAPTPVALQQGRVTVASADADSLPAAALGFAPLPPRRPAEAVLAAAASPNPAAPALPKAPARVQTASLDDELPAMPLPVLRPQSPVLRGGRRGGRPGACRCVEPGARRRVGVAGLAAAFLGDSPRRDATSAQRPGAVRRSRPFRRRCGPAVPRPALRAEARRRPRPEPLQRPGR